MTPHTMYVVDLGDGAGECLVTMWTGTNAMSFDYRARSVDTWRPVETRGGSVRVERVP